MIFPRTQRYNLETLVQLFQIAVHFHPGHPQLKTLTDSLDTLILLPSTKLDYYFVGSIDAYKIVFSKLLYCSTVWSNTSNSNIGKLQKVQNFAGRIILGLKKYDHISDGLRSLKWLPIREKLILNDATMAHKCINKLVPDYLADKFKLRSQVHNRQTRSSGALDIPLCRLSTGQRQRSQTLELFE